MMINGTNAEYLVIGALLRNPDLFGELALKQEMFADIYSHNFIKYANQHNKVDIADIYAQSQKYGNEFFPENLMEKLLNDRLIMKSHFTQYQIDVLEIYKKRKIKEATDNYTKQPNRENQLFLESTLKYLNDIEIKRKDTKAETLSTIKEELLQEVKPRLLKTGYKNLDSLISGFEPGQLVVIAARPSMGKTAFALNIGCELESNNCNVAVFSLETTAKKITQRVIASRTLVNLSKFKYPESINQDEMLKITEFMDRFQKMNFMINDGSQITPKDIQNQAARMMNESDNNVIIIDYLTLMKSDENIKDRRLEVEDISRKLKIIAKEYKCVIIALSQLSRGVEGRNDKRPVMSDLREAGGVEQDADMIFMLYRPDYYNKEQEETQHAKSDVECIVAKNKDGATGTADFEFYRKVQRFY